MCRFMAQTWCHTDTVDISRRFFRPCKTHFQRRHRREIGERPVVIPSSEADVRICGSSKPLVVENGLTIMVE